MGKWVALDELEQILEDYRRILTRGVNWDEEFAAQSQSDTMQSLTTLVGASLTTSVPVSVSW